LGFYLGIDYRPQITVGPSGPAVLSYLKGRTEQGTGIDFDSMQVLRDDPHEDGHLVLVTYRIRPEHPLYADGERVVELLRIDATGAVVGGSDASTLAPADMPTSLT
jgi:hypothetical protein